MQTTNISSESIKDASFRGKVIELYDFLYLNKEKMLYKSPLDTSHEEITYRDVMSELPIEDVEMELDCMVNHLRKQHKIHLLTNRVYTLNYDKNDELGWFYKIFDISSKFDTKSPYQSASIYTEHRDALAEGVMNCFKIINNRI